LISKKTVLEILRKALKRVLTIHPPPAIHDRLLGAGVFVGTAGVRRRKRRLDFGFWILDFGLDSVVAMACAGG
jgi:hypothetical protein